MGQNNIANILNSLRSEFIIIGLTGALGSGCTESAKFLSEENNPDEINSLLDSTCKDEFDLEYRKLQRVKYFYKENKGWDNFFHIRVSDLLFLILINEIENQDNMLKISEFMDIEEDTKEIDIFKEKNNLTDIKSLAKIFIETIKDEERKDEIDIKNILDKTNEYIKNNIEKSNSIYTKLFQAIGQNIRSNGSIYKNAKSLLKNTLNLDSEFDNLSIFVIPEIIRLTIKRIRNKNKIEKKKDFFVIDALRNSYEIEFFRNRYQSFYLLSIMASENTRKDRILNSFKLKIHEHKNIIDFETNDKGVESQAINACIGKGDIFINNDMSDSSKSKLYLQLIKYIALIRKPGLFTPNDDERFMQVAFTARYNSGCISRQVGAAVVGVDGYLRGFGWNDVPEKHISCLYRTPQQLLSNNNNYIFSTYERSDKFYEPIKNKFENKNTRYLPFCFKDNQNDIEIKNSAIKIKKNDASLIISESEIATILKNAKLKNPTRERALHAEENVFLQIAKSGGQTVIGGTLYSTDSPCQLCSKKTMQLKIKRVVYIDAYPDISVEHTLRAGTEDLWPAFDMFSGAIGAAYFKLFVPIIGRKDEIQYL